jgi:hypothetical protein
LKVTNRAADQKVDSLRNRIGKYPAVSPVEQSERFLAAVSAMEREAAEQFQPSRDNAKRERP